MFRPFRTLLSTSRLPYRVEHKIEHGLAANITRARFRKLPWDRRAKTFFINCAGIYCAWQIYKYVMIPIALKLEGPEEEDDDEEELEPLFLPILGTAKLLPPVPYSGTDPEWKAFVKFGREKEAGKKVRDQLAAHVLKVATMMPALRKDGRDIKLRRAWLDIDYPHSAPPEYERSGFELRDDGIYWTTRNVDANTVTKIRSILYPKAMILSGWEFVRVIAADEYARVSNYLGFQSTPPPPTFEQFLLKHQQMSRPPQIPSASGPSLQPTPSNGAKTIESGSSTDKTTVVTTTKHQSEIEVSPVTKHGLDLVAYFYRPIMAMKRKFVTTWKPAQMHGPKGSMVVSGLVEIETTRLWIVFDVLAFYDPTEKTFDQKSMRVLPRRVQQKKQGPLGRPKAPPLPVAPPQAGKPY